MSDDVRGLAEVQHGLHGPQRLEEHHVDPVLAAQELLYCADLGNGQQLRDSVELLATKSPTGRANCDSNRRVVPDALHLSRPRVGFHQQPAVVLDEPYRRGYRRSVTLVAGDAQIPAWKHLRVTRQLRQ